MLDELRTFIAVVEQRNFTRAAESLNLSQPSVSVHIKNLEKSLNCTLITRSVKQKGILITESGNILYKRAKEIIKICDTTKSEISNISNTVKGNLKIGATYTIGECVLPKILKCFSDLYKDIEFELVIGNTEEITSRVKSLELDIGLIEGIANSSEFEQEYFLDDELVIMLPKDHKLNNKSFDYSLLNNEIFLAREEGSGTRDYLNIFLTDNFIVPSKTIVFGSNYSIREAVKSGLGITVISKYVALESYKYNEIDMIELGDRYKRHFSHLVPKGIMKSKPLELFIDMISETRNMEKIRGMK